MAELPSGLVDVVKLTDRPTLALALENYIAHCTANGTIYKISVQGFIDYIAPKISALGASGYVAVTGLALPTPSGDNSFSIVGKGIYTHSGGDVVANGDLNILSWDGTVWSLTKEIDLDMSQYIDDTELGNQISLSKINNGIDVLNYNVSSIHTSDNTPLSLVKNTSPVLIKNMMRMRSNSNSYNQFDLITPGKIDYTVNSVLGFWINTTPLSNDSVTKFLLYFYNENLSDLGNDQSISVLKSQLQTEGYQYALGSILELKIKEVVGSWSYIQFLIKPNSGITNVNYFHLYFVLNPLSFNTDFDFASFTFINGASELNPYLVYNNGYLSGKSLSNKKWVFFGDSITAENAYQKEIQNELGIPYINNAVPGSCVTPGYGDPSTAGRSLAERVGEVNALNPDVVVIFAGTNDYGYEAPIGSVTDTATTTFYGAYKYILAQLQTYNPRVEIIIITPLFGNNGLGPSAGKTNEQVWYLRKPYADAEIELAGIFSIKVWDAFRLSDIGIYNYPTWLADTIHPTPEGYKRLGVYFTRFLKTVL